MLTGRLPSADEVDHVRYGGEEALRSVLSDMLQEEAFYDRLKEIYNDRLLTDRYLGGTNAIGLIDEDVYPNLYWYENETNATTRNALRNQLNEALAREPLELIAHVVREGLPFTEILTADYTMANAFSALSMGTPIGVDPHVSNPLSRDYVPVRVDGVAHAGVLTTAAFLNRFPTTPTNRNRHRARVFFDRFLATDILAFADRPIDPTSSSVHNPTLNDAQCTVCHDTLDPVAGLFQNWDEDGHFNPREEGWYPEMAIPGFGDSTLPYDEEPSALQWLAANTVTDPRFALATARTLFGGITGLPVLTAANTRDDELDNAVYQLQRAFLDDIAQAFVTDHYEVRTLVERIVLSHYFRAAGHQGATEAQLVQAGTAHLLTPEELARKVEAVMGYPWSERFDREPYLLDRYRMLYGGIDSSTVTERLVEPNGIMSSIGLRLSFDLACRTVAQDFVLPREQRRLFPMIESTYEPETVDGFAIPEVQTLIKENIRYLHLRLLGEELSQDDPELEATYQLFYATWQEGKAAVDAGDESTWMHSRCQANQDFWTRQNLPDEHRVRQDPTFIIRAWMATTAYLLADYPLLLRVMGNTMDRRKFIKLASLAGLSLAGPALPRPLFANDAGFDGPFWITIHAGGGWDPTLLCDPKGRTSATQPDPVNNYGVEDILDIGPFRTAPIDGHQAFFERFHSELLVINGIDVGTNSHQVGTRHTWSGSMNPGTPSISAVVAGTRAERTALPFLTNGGYDITDGLVAPTRIPDTSAITEIAFPHQITSNNEVTYFSESTLSRIKEAREARMARQIEEATLPRVKRAMGQLQEARSGDSELNRFINYLPSTLDNTGNQLIRQAQIALAAFRAGLTVSANLNIGGFDTHGNHDNQHTPRIQQILEGVTFIMDQAEALGIRDKVIVLVGSDFARTPWYNENNGKDHWSVTSMMLMGPGIIGGRVVGATDYYQSPLTVDPQTLELSESGIRITPGHIHAALRDYAQASSDPDVQRHPVGTALPLLG